MVINTQDTNNTTGGMVINTEETNYPIRGMVINTQDANAMELLVLITIPLME